MSSAGIIAVALSIVTVTVVAFPLGKTLKKYPWFFYAAGIIAACAYLWAVFTGQRMAPIRPLMLILQRGYVGMLFLGLVMFIGVFDEKSRFRIRLQPIRGELSILSFIFLIPHIVTYLMSYLPHLSHLLASKGNVVFSLIVALVLSIIFILLSVLSFPSIHKRMNRKVWKNIQRLSYFMMVLLAVHVLFVLGKSALTGNADQSAITLGIYIVLILVYAVLRIRKAVHNRKTSKIDEVTAKM